MKAYEGVDAKIRVFLTSALIGVEREASSPGLFVLGERTSSTHWTGGQMGPRTSLNDVERTILLPMGLELLNLKYIKKKKVNLKIKQSMVKCINIYVFLYAKREQFWKML
jgi:hypothetical protein